MIQTLSSRYNELREAAQTLIDALPKCVKCGKPATRTYLVMYYYCDDCSTTPESSHAAELRALIALLGAP